MDKKVVLITGGNAGIGYAICRRLLLQDAENIHLCLCCRNKQNAENTKKRLLLEFSAEITIIIIDTCLISSVYKAASEIKRRFSHIDYLYLNAGIMPVSTVSSIDWKMFWKTLFSSQCLAMFQTGYGLLKQVDGITSEGLKEVFATNVFGHFVLVTQLLDHLGGERHSRIIWTSSSNAKKVAFSIEDIQNTRGFEPYSSSKYQIDMLSVALNEKLGDRNISSYTTCPGLVMTNLTLGIMPQWFWMLVLPIIMLLRLFMGSMTHTPENGAEAAVWLYGKKCEALNGRCKYHSRVSVCGNKYVECKQMDVDTTLVNQIHSQLSDLATNFSSHTKTSD